MTSRPDYASFVKTVENYPKDGVSFKDITPLLADAKAFGSVIDDMAERFRPSKVDVVASPEARGFLFGCGIAYALHAGFIPVRKPNKLPRESVSAEYKSEYGTATLSIHADAIRPGQRVLIVDDLLATGGTIKAAHRLVEKLGGVVVGYCFLIELKALNGRQALPPGAPVFSVLEL